MSGKEQLKHIECIFSKYQQQNNALQNIEIEKNNEKNYLEACLKEQTELLSLLKNDVKHEMELAQEKESLLQQCAQYNEIIFKQNEKIQESLNELEGLKAESSKKSNEFSELGNSFIRQNKDLHCDLEETTLMQELQELKEKLNKLNNENSQTEDFDCGDFQSNYAPPFNCSKLLSNDVEKSDNIIKNLERKIHESIKLKELYEKEAEEALLKLKSLNS